MTPLLEPIASVVRATTMILSRSTDNLAEPDTKTRVRAGQGPSLAWELGHVLDFRCQLLKLLGTSRDNPYAAIFPVSGANDGSNYPPISELRRDLEQLGSELEIAMAAVTEESLRGEVQQTPHGEKTLLDSIVFLVWHEAYHVGAVGGILKALGYPGPAEVARSRAA